MGYNQIPWCNIRSNWLAPIKQRRLIIAGKQKTLVYQEIEDKDHIYLYPCQHEAVYQQQAIPNKPERIAIESFDDYDNLTRQLAHFASCIHSGEKPITDGEQGLRIVNILEAADRSLEHQGKLVSLT